MNRLARRTLNIDRKETVARNLINVPDAILDNALLFIASEGPPGVTFVFVHTQIVALHSETSVTLSNVMRTSCPLIATRQHVSG